ncbi:hypothetical protein ALC57_15632, partial [Trachymyrmex cornetzi]
RGLGFKIKLVCQCGDRFINSCHMINNAYEGNRRFVYVMRLIGVGLQGINYFYGYMDIGKTFNINLYYNIVNSISVSMNAVYDFVIRKAVREEKELNKNAGFPENELSVSGDGSWSKRGFSSLLGIISLIGKFSNKIVGTVVKSSFYRACNTWSSREDTDEYDAWYETHEPECQANRQGSAGKMEVDGIIEMFQRSVEKYGVKYAYYIGDGDTKTFKNLLETAPYSDDFVVKKKECVLHIKKRMYRRAKEAKKQLTQQKKALNQVGSKVAATLTNKVMQDLSLYYGLAIQRHPDSVEDMQREIWANYYHKISTDEKPQHHFCPEGASSWCKWQQYKAAGTPYFDPPALDRETQEILKPIYEELSQRDLLERYLGANTQNNNESFNACVWCLAPKHVFCGKILEIATQTAACMFNEGQIPILKILETMGCVLGSGSVRFAEDCDNARVRQADRRTSDASKSAQIARREARAAKDELYDQEEGTMYGPGIAD